MTTEQKKSLTTEEHLNSKEGLARSSKQIKKKVAGNDASTIKFSKLFRYCNKTDYFLIVIGTISAAANGAIMPVLALIFGSATASFSPTNPPDVIVSEGRKYSLDFLYAGIGAFFVAQLSMTCWMMVGERQTINYRREYFRALLRQEIGYFDRVNPYELSTEMANDCQMIWQGIGGKVQTFIYNFVIIITGFTIGFWKGWELSLIMLINIPLIFIGGSLYMWSVQKSTQKKLEAYQKSGGIVEQALYAFKTVVALCGEDKEVARYKNSLEDSKPIVVMYGIIEGFFIGILLFAIISCYALGLFYGSYLIEWKRWNPAAGKPYDFADVLSIVSVNLMAAFSIFGLTGHMKAFSLAKNAGAKIMQVIDRVSEIDTENQSGEKPQIKATIEFKDAKFAYPLNPKNQILKGISFIARPKQKVAFVGQSGCGKTTAMQLIQRLYELDSGDILFDGLSIKSINLRWLRDNISYVGQQPVLFATSIRENLKFAKPDATEDEIWAALKATNMDVSVRGLKDGLNTLVGSGGAQLSENQKQRIAIARVILKNPKILLLDETTSALDRKNEIDIQKILEEIAQNRTTIVIAHRLSTIRNFDVIIVFDGGHIVEEGTHDELIKKRGKYFQLVFQELPPEEEQKILGKAGDADQIEIQITKAQKKEDESTQKILVEEKESKSEKSKVLSHEETEVQKRLMSYVTHHRYLLYIAFLISIANGSIFAASSVLIAHMIQTLALPGSPTFRHDANVLSLCLLMLGCASFILQPIERGIYALIGEQVTTGVRTDVFQKLLRMHMGFYDNPLNSVGSFFSKLAFDATQVNSLFTTGYGALIGGVGTLITGIAIAFLGSWQLALIGIGILPIMLTASKVNAQKNQEFSAKRKEAYVEADDYLSEALCNMRTVASFAREDLCLKKYASKLEGPLHDLEKKIAVSGLAFGFSEFARFLLYFGICIVWAYLTKEINLNIEDLFLTTFGIMFGALGAGNATNALTETRSARQAAIELFRLIDMKSEIDVKDEKDKITKEIIGDIEFRNVSFKYPTCSQYIFQNLNLKINAANKIALFGRSGCGKSTVIQLIQRFYDVTSGEILLDGVDIRNYNLKLLRQTLGIVSQEPVLFNGTIEDNIKYTRPEASDEEMREVARQADALTFIEKSELEEIATNEKKDFGQGFQRRVGPKGSQISGGQKQRIAIARALLKKPKILLLDEATSALDSQSEAAVQGSLDKIMQGKTTVMISHRISTIKNSNEILVLDYGRVAERGTYQELLKLKGRFYEFVGF